MKWHKISEELPTADKPVIVAKKPFWDEDDYSYKSISLSIYNDHKQWIDDDWRRFDLNDFDYWTEIEPPKSQ